MKEIIHANIIDQLYLLFSIFGIMASSNEYHYLSSVRYSDPTFYPKDSSMQKALEYIHKNFHKQISIKQILDITNMSNTTFCQTFKKYFRMTFKEYINNIRISYACSLLEHDSFNIAQVAYTSGFENIFHFNRQFKRIKEITPREYQKIVTLRQDKKL